MSFFEGNTLEDYEDIATYNRALSLLVSNNLEDATNEFSQAMEMSDDPFIKSRSHYNTGNIELLKDQPDLEKAINSYKKALRIDPNLESARKNLALAYKLLQQQQQQQTQQNQPHRQQQPTLRGAVRRRRGPGSSAAPSRGRR